MPVSLRRTWRGQPSVKRPATPAFNGPPTSAANRPRSLHSLTNCHPDICMRAACARTPCLCSRLSCFLKQNGREEFQVICTQALINRRVNGEDVRCQALLCDCSSAGLADVHQTFTRIPAHPSGSTDPGDRRRPDYASLVTGGNALGESMQVTSHLSEETILFYYSLDRPCRSGSVPPRSSTIF